MSVNEKQIEALYKSGIKSVVLPNGDTRKIIVRSYGPGRYTYQLEQSEQAKVMGKALHDLGERFDPLPEDIVKRFCLSPERFPASASVLAGYEISELIHRLAVEVAINRLQSEISKNGY